MELKNIRQNAKKTGVPIIRDESHLLLEKMVNEIKPKKILEIGTAVGYSGILMLKNCDANLITIEHNKNYITQAKQNFKNEKLAKRVKILEGDCVYLIAKMVLDKKYENYFDFIFLDGPKAQYEYMLENLIFILKPNGTLLADNIGFRGYTNGEKTPPTKRFKTIITRLNNFIDNCKNNPRLFEFEKFDIEDGLIKVKKV